MYITTSSDEGASTLKELIRFSSKVTAPKPANGSSFPRFERIDSDTGATAQTEQQSVVKNYAAPLTPLTERDLDALAEMFELQDNDEIEADIMQHLHLLCPEPCWEEETFEFLQDYL